MTSWSASAPGSTTGSPAGSMPSRRTATKIHIDVDPSSINKNVHVDIPIIGDCAHVLEDMIRVWKARSAAARQAKRSRPGGAQIATNGASRDCLEVRAARRRDHAAIRDPAALRADQGPRDLSSPPRSASTRCGPPSILRHFEEPNRWMTSGGLGTMGYGLPAAVGVQKRASRCARDRHRRRSVCILMTMQEMSTAVQYRLPIKSLHPEQRIYGHGAPVAAAAPRQPDLSESYMDSLPDFVKLAEAYGACRHSGPRSPSELDDAIKEMISVDQAGAVRLPRAQARQLLSR